MSTASISSPPPWPRRAWWLAGTVVLLAVVGFSVTRSMRAQAETVVAQSAEHATPWLENGVIRYPTSFANREKIGFTEAKEGVLTPSLYVTGSVTCDARRVAEIGARIEGRVRSVSKVEGEDVSAGEVVAELESVELGKSQAEVLKARAKEQVAKLDAERERKLADAKISAERDAQFAQAAAEAATAERIAAEKSVEALGGTVGGEVGILKLRSPLAGRIVEHRARRGATVSPTDTMLVVADLSRVWVEFSVFERDVSAVREGDRIDIYPADRATPYPATVAHVSEVIDPTHRTAHVRVELPNPDGALRPGLSVTGTLHTSGPRHSQLMVPRRAVTRIDGKPTVFVRSAASENAVEPREVKVGPEDADDIAVLEGLNAGEQVVTSGVLALKAEVFR